MEGEAATTPQVTTFDSILAKAGKAPDKPAETTPPPAKEEKPVPGSEKIEGEDDAPPAGASEEGDDESDAEDDDAGGEVEAAAPKKTKKGPGVIKAKKGTEDVDLPDDAKITQKVNGKDVTFTLKEAVNSFLTRGEIDRKNSELDTRARAIKRREGQIATREAEYLDLEEGLAVLKEAAAKRDIMAVAQATFEMLSGGDDKLNNEIFQGLRKLTDDLAVMDDDEVRGKLKTNSQTIAQMREDRRIKRERARLDAEKLKNYVDGVKKTHNISDSEFAAQYETIVEGDKVRVAKGEKPYLHEKMTGEDITKVVASWVLGHRQISLVRNVVARYSKDKSDDAEFIGLICEHLKGSFSEKDVDEIVRGVFKVKPKKATKPVKEGVSSQSATPPKEGVTGKEATPKAQKESEDDGPVTFDKIIARSQKK